MAAKGFLDGIKLVPVSADPSGAVNGQLQFSDGSHRAQGLWQLVGGVWTQIAQNPPAEPKDVTLVNPKFEVDLVGWLVDGPGTPLLTRNTTLPLSGIADAHITTTAVGTSPTNLSVHDYVETDFTLTDRVQTQEQLLISFDMEFIASQVGASDPGGSTSNRDIINVAVLDQATSTVITSLTLFDASTLSLTGVKYQVEALLNISSSTDTDLSLRIFSYVNDPLVEKVVDTVYAIDNVNILSKNITKVGNT